MNKFIYLAPLCAAVLLVAGCGSQTVKPRSQSLVERMIPKPLAVQGAALLKQAHEENSTVALREAAKLLQQAHQYQPDDVNIQLNLYQALYQLSAIEDQILPELQTLYEVADPGIRTSLAPPSSLEVKKRVRQNGQQMTEDDRRWILQLLSESPSNYQGWAALLIYDISHAHPWTSMIAMQRMLALNPGSVPLRLDLALYMEKLAEQNGCRYDRAPLLRSAANHYAQAAAKSGDMKNYEIASELYIATGQFPLAYISAQKVSQAYGMDGWRRKLLTDSSIRLGKLTEAKQLAEDRISIDKDDYGYTDLARLSMLEGDKTGAAKHFANFDDIQDGKPFTLTEYLRDWLYQLGHYEGELVAIQDTGVKTDWHKTLVKAIEKVKAEGGEPTELLSQAQSGCHLTEAHFYAAYLYWLRGDVAKAKEHLMATKAKKIYRYFEHEWADVLYEQL